MISNDESVVSRDDISISDLVYTPQNAVIELKRRRSDQKLMKKVSEYLNGDIPDYLSNGAVAYLARHVITPNFETLRFTHLISHLGLKTVISHDSKALFVSQNVIKRALCKLPICKRISQKNGKLNEQYQFFTIVHFQESDGKMFRDIVTKSGEPLVDFHRKLFLTINHQPCELPDDAEWIDRHNRGNLLEHYKHLLALFLVHGVFFENYNLTDEHEVRFVHEVLRPACEFLEQKFGCKPLIAEVFPTTLESYQFWISYPKSVLQLIKIEYNNIKL